MDTIQLIKKKLPLSMDPEDSDIEIAAAEVGQSILTYCNRSDIPKDLAFVHINMVADYLKAEATANDPEAQSMVKSVKEGDVQVTFEATKPSKQRVMTEEILFNYTSQLNRFRKVRR